MITITDWNETFENAGSRKLKRLEFCNMPVNLNSSGYLELVTEHGSNGLKAFGVFISLVQLTATFPVERRGSFAKSSGEEMTEKQIAALLRISEEDLCESLQLLKRPSVGWVTITDPPTISQSSPNDLPIISHSSPNDPPVKSDHLPPTVEGEGEYKDNDKVPPKPPKGGRVSLSQMLDLIEDGSPYADSAERWAEYKSQLPARDSYRSEQSWLANLKRMKRYPVSVVAEAVDRAISQGWKGWEQDSVLESAFPEAAKPATQKAPEWAQHPRFREAASEILGKPFEGTWQDFPKIRVTELEAELEAVTA